MRRRAPLIAFLLLLAGCGGEDDPPSAAAPTSTPTAAATVTPAPSADPSPGSSAPYVGSLSVDPESGTLMIGTGLGLLRLEEGAKQAEPLDGELTTPDGSGAISPNLVVRYTGPCLLYTSPSPRDLSTSRMPSSA